MEDWSYGAGFESSPSPITVCKPTTYGGYRADLGCTYAQEDLQETSQIKPSLKLVKEVVRQFSCSFLVGRS